MECSQQRRLSCLFFLPGCIQVEVNRSSRVQCVVEQAASSVYMDSRSVTLRSTLLPGRYVVLPTTFLPGVPGRFLLRVFSHSGVWLRWPVLHWQITVLSNDTLTLHCSVTAPVPFSSSSHPVTESISSVVFAGSWWRIYLLHLCCNVSYLSPSLSPRSTCTGLQDSASQSKKVLRTTHLTFTLVY